MIFSKREKFTKLHMGIRDGLLLERLFGRSHFEKQRIELPLAFRLQPWLRNIAHSELP